MNKQHNRNNYNEPDLHGIHQYRFKWNKKIIRDTENVVNIVLRMMRNEPQFYFNIKKDNNIYEEKEILNSKFLHKLEQMGNKFKVIGAKGRNVIVGEVNLKEFDHQNKKVLILSSLIDWRRFAEKYKVN
ncbi:MAG: hypothetical protein GF364_21385 [Candidatus Lokiarchaeota archaeon]|nr:hypothetical protein [Candidatus Lokiarchaeota archaeon]